MQLSFVLTSPTHKLHIVAEWSDCVGSCAFRRPLSHRRIVDGDIASSCASAPFASHRFIRRGRPNTQSAIRLQDLRICGADISVNLRARGTFSSFSPKHGRDRRHRTDCAAFRFPSFYFRRLCECIGRFSSDVLWTKYIPYSPLQCASTRTRSCPSRLCFGARIGEYAFVKNRRLSSGLKSTAV